jgi:uncharacterized protein involved in oxidation of intracellular sulfur
MTVLIILDDAPYGSERSYNGLRLATALLSREGTDVRVFLMADAVGCAKSGQKVSAGYYNVEAMIGALGKRGASIGLCATCMNARGLTDPELIAGAHRSSMQELAAWTIEADRTVVF